jgi:hypothetical protein
MLELGRGEAAGARDGQFFQCVEFAQLRAVASSLAGAPAFAPGGGASCNPRQETMHKTLIARFNMYHVPLVAIRRWLSTRRLRSDALGLIERAYWGPFARGRPACQRSLKLALFLGSPRGVRPCSFPGSELGPSKLRNGSLPNTGVT